MFTFSVIIVDLTTDCILSFLFPAKTDVLVPVFSQSTDIVVINFVVVLKFPIIVLLKMPTKYQEFFPPLFVKTTDFQLVFNFEQKHTVTIFGEHMVYWLIYHDG